MDDSSSALVPVQRQESSKKPSMVVMSGEKEAVLVMRQSSLAGLAQQIKWVSQNLPSLPQETPSFISINHGQSVERPTSLSEYLNIKCRALVPVKPRSLPLPNPEFLFKSPSPPPPYNTDPLYLPPLDQNQLKSSSSDLLCHSLECKEKEELRQDSDDELDMPTQQDIVPNFSHSYSPVITSPDYQGPPRKMAKLSCVEEERGEYWDGQSEAADDGSSTIDQAVPGSEDCAQGYIPSPSQSPCQHHGGRGGGGGGEGKDAIEIWSESQQVVPHGPGETEEDHGTTLYYDKDSQKHTQPSTTSWREEKDNCPRKEEGLDNESTVTWSLHSSYLQTCTRCSRRGNNENCPVTVPLNLSRPRLRLGLSRCRKPRSLHHSLYSREE